MAPSDPTGRIEAFKKKEKENGKCAICGAFVTTVLMQHNSFVCSRCSGILRECGLTVKGITMTNWTAADADKICSGGNRKEKEELCASWDGSELAVNPDSKDRDVKKFITAKYVDKKWARKGGGSSSSYSGGGGSASASASKASPDDARKLASMFPDLNEAKAADLLRQCGSIEEAVEKYLMSGPPEEPAQSSKHDSSGGKSHHKDAKKKDEKKKKHSKHSRDEDSMPLSSFNSAPAMSGFSNPDVAPPALGEAMPDKVGGMAGMVGMLARGEIDAPSSMGSQQWGSCGGGGGGGGFGGGQYNSVPGNFGSQQQGGGWGGMQQPMQPATSSFNSGLDSRFGSQSQLPTPQMSDNLSSLTPRSPMQTLPPQGSPPANPFASQQGGQGWGSQPQSQSGLSSEQQERLAQLQKLRARKQEILRNLQQRQAMGAASPRNAGSMGGCAPFHGSMGPSSMSPSGACVPGGASQFESGGFAPNSSFNMGGMNMQPQTQTGFSQAQAPYPQNSCGGFGCQQSQMYPQNAF